MAFYIATFEAGKDPYRPQHVTRFDDMNDFYRCVCEWTRHSVEIYPSWTIDRMLEVLEDDGPGFGKRWHRRISAKDAKEFGFDG